MFCDAGRMEPVRANVENKTRPHEKTVCCSEEKEEEDSWMASKMAGVMGLARLGTCERIRSIPRSVRWR